MQNLNVNGGWVLQYPLKERTVYLGIDYAKGVEVCHCVGPQNGDPVCPCRMKSVRIVDGRYVEQIDHGPAPKEKWRG